MSQLEESNKTLTKDVENLSKEKAELDEKLSTQEEGTLNQFTLVPLVFWIYAHVRKTKWPLVFFFLVRVRSSKGGNSKFNEGQLWEDPQHGAHAEDPGNDAFTGATLRTEGSRTKGDSVTSVVCFSTDQAVNKLAEIMNRKDMKLDQKKKGSTADLRKKEKENRKLQLELNQEKEKFNHMAIKYQKELNEMQAVGSEGHANAGARWSFLDGFHHQQQLAEECTYRNELQMQLDSKESDIEQLREKLNDLQQRMENSSVTSLQTDETDSNVAGECCAGFHCAPARRPAWGSLFRGPQFITMLWFQEKKCFRFILLANGKLIKTAVQLVIFLSSYFGVG